MYANKKNLWNQTIKIKNKLRITYYMHCNVLNSNLAVGKYNK